jgi:hypothetical protein
MHVGDRSTWLNSVESSCDDFKIILSNYFDKIFSEKIFYLKDDDDDDDDDDDVFDIFSLKIRLL